jgi:ABC-type transport system involved in multi-copper enzyme maturation permease subunit
LVPLLRKELREVAGGRALWTMLLILCPLVGSSFLQAIALYGESSAAALQSPTLAASLSPLDGVLVPTFGSFYVCVTLLFPFVAIRALGIEKESGTLRLLVQLPYGRFTLVGAKLTAILAVWLATAIPALSTLVWWRILGGHLHGPETANLLLGHLLYGLLVAAIALFAAAVSDNTATAAIVTLALTIGSWVLDFTVAGRSGALEWLAMLSLTQVLRAFEQGLLSAGLVLGAIAIAGAFIALAGVWLHPGMAVRHKLGGSLACVAVAALALGVASQVKVSTDVTEDRRNSFPVADERALAGLPQLLSVTVHLAPEDPRYLDLWRNVLTKLERSVPRISIRLAGSRVAAGDSRDRYGEIEYRYGARQDVSRSTSPREILPLIYGLAGIAPPAAVAADEYPGYPLVADGAPALAWFFGILPVLIIIAWWWSRRPPRTIIHEGGLP